jgi:hypothetical protein
LDNLVISIENPSKACRLGQPGEINGQEMDVSWKLKGKRTLTELEQAED